MKNFDVFIRNSKIIDGTGNPGFFANVGIIDEKIDYIGSEEKKGSIYIDGEGLVLSPGFIDTHTHNDLFIFNDSTNFLKLAQGITTEIGGNCGVSIAPNTREYSEMIKQVILHACPGLQVPYTFEKFNQYDTYLSELDKLKLGNNIGYLVGQGTIRMAVMGYENRKASQKEMDKMIELFQKAMESGAFGLSTGLIYAPGTYTPVDEILELCKIVAKYGGVYATHMRTEADNIIEAVKESIEVGRQTGCSIQISHFKVSGKHNWGKHVEVLKLVEEANKEGINVNLDMYPYTAGNGTLCDVLPPEFLGIGGPQKIAEVLSDKKQREIIREKLVKGEGVSENFIELCGYEGIMVVNSDKTTEALGKSIKDYSVMHNLEPVDALLDILIKNNGSVDAAYFQNSEETIEAGLKSPYLMIGTDTFPVAKGRRTHPRSIATYPRILGKYVREKGLLTLQEAIMKMTSLPAQKFGLKGKGLIKEGFNADLVLFNPEIINDSANYIDCYSKNEGIKYVIVNGSIAVQDNKYTGNAAGKVIRHY